MTKIKDLDCILLIDDDDATNFIHQEVIKRSEIEVFVETTTSGQMALDFLTCQGEFSHVKEYPQPGIIFLDINMPGMNGWEFLEKYNHLPENQKGKIVVSMLTTSLNPDDKNQSQNYPDVQHFYNKPLTTELLIFLANESFPLS